MKYSTRLAHLEKQPHYSVGDIVNPNDFLGIMGNTGQSKGDHIHVDSVVGIRGMHWRVDDCEKGFVEPAPEQTDYLISLGLDQGFFKCKPIVTECYHSSNYTRIVKKRHWGTDVVPSVSENKKCYWNRSCKATVLFSGYDNGYGYSLILGYEV